jgi:hypothetical protein
MSTWQHPVAEERYLMAGLRLMRDLWGVLPTLRMLLFGLLLKMKGRAVVWPPEIESVFYQLATNNSLSTDVRVGHSEGNYFRLFPLPRFPMAIFCTE